MLLALRLPVPDVFNLMRKCKISGFHGSDEEEWGLLGCYGVWLL
jgi:hypothetical protein